MTSAPLTLTSQVIITQDIEATIATLETLRRGERIVKIIKEDTFLVEDAKLAIEKAYMASQEQTVILLGAKLFSPVVQNKLLKVIEEPPVGVSFILLTVSKSTILPTIRSRLPIVVLSETKTIEDLGLDIAHLTLQSVYDFIQTHKRTDAKTMKSIVERIAKEAIACGAYRLDTPTLDLFTHSYQALDMGSPPQFVLITLLLKLLARKQR